MKAWFEQYPLIFRYNALNGENSFVYTWNIVVHGLMQEINISFFVFVTLNFLGVVP